MKDTKLALVYDNNDLELTNCEKNMCMYATL